MLQSLCDSRFSFILQYAVRLQGYFHFSIFPTFVDLIVVIASVAVLSAGSQNQVFATSAIR